MREFKILRVLEIIIYKQKLKQTVAVKTAFERKLQRNNQNL